ncbi:MAG: helix-turn-helix transcriptional regulator [Acutalibacteraceae bacterium]|nr:helix-turn-helix transcriptional regulator [Acutalibacteraceae bacterium]
MNTFTADNFSQNLKKLRKQADFTQEELADELNVSFQAVSKWERGESQPDFDTLLKLSRLFCVSTDELLSASKAEDEQKIADYIAKYHKLTNSRQFDECKQLMEIACSQYPSSYALLVRKMEILLKIHNTDRESACAVYNKVFAIYQKIMQRCLDDSIRIWAKRLYCQLCRKTGDTDEMNAIIDTLPRMVDCRENVRMIMTDKSSSEHSAACAHSIEEHVLYLTASICNNNYYIADCPSTEKIAAAKTAAAIIDAVYPNGDYGRATHSIAWNYALMGQWYAQIGDNENALAALQKCSDIVVAYKNLPKKTQHTSPLVRALSYEKSHDDYAQTHACSLTKQIAEFIGERYEFSAEFKSDKRFCEILNTLKNA